MAGSILFHVYEEDEAMRANQKAHESSASHGTFEAVIPDGCEALVVLFQRLASMDDDGGSSFSYFLDEIAERGLAGADENEYYLPTNFTLVIVRRNGQLEQVHLLPTARGFRSPKGCKSEKRLLKLHLDDAKLFDAWAEYDHGFLKLATALLTAAVRKSDEMAVPV